MADRRDLLRWGVAGAGLALAPPGLAAGARPAYPPDVGSKFFPDGRVHPFAGNTIICHLPQQGEAAGCFDAMLDLYREAPRHAFLRKVALLPPSSYHMTVFGGANDRPRRRESWPADLTLDMPIAACSQAIGERLRDFDPQLTLPIRMRVDPEQRPEPGRALVFHLLPFDDAENARLRGLRDRLADRLKIRGAGHEGYRFHISFGYPLAWFDSAEQAAFERTWRDWATRLAARCPEILLGAPEYCTFEDMFAFHRLFHLGEAG